MAATRNVDLDIANARARLAVATRHGRQDDALEARLDLLLANERRAARIAAENRERVLALQKEIQAQQEARIALDQQRLDELAAFLADPTTTTTTTPPFTKENHNVLELAQLAEGKEFVTSHGPAAKWDEETRDQWSNLLARHTEAHQVFGCSQMAPCRQAR